MTDRSAYIEKMKARIDEWNAEIDKFEAKARQANADARIRYEEQLGDMRKQRDAALARLKEAQAASDKAWDDMRKGF